MVRVKPTSYNTGVGQSWTVATAAHASTYCGVYESDLPQSVADTVSVMTSLLLLSTVINNDDDGGGGDDDDDVLVTVLLLNIILFCLLLHIRL